MFGKHFFTLSLLGFFIGNILSSPIAFAEEWPVPFLPETLSISWKNGEKIVDSETILSWFRIVNTTQYQKNFLTEALSPKICSWKYSFCDFSLTSQIRYSSKNKTVFSLDEIALKKFFQEIDTEIREEPINALFSINETGAVSIFSPSRDGLGVDIEKSVQVFKDALISLSDPKISMTLPLIALKPDIVSTDANRLGITNTLSEGRTNFSGSPKNRVFNIRRAIEQFHGILIAPGEEFSFVKTLGNVDEENGYLPELVIKRGKTEPEFGGGICQVSTTLFRAALNAGLKITERRNHAYPVQYYKPYGMDATIYIPKPDFRFINNTPAYILIQVAIEQSELVFRLYGTADGREVQIDGPHILERNTDGSMKTIFSQKVLDSRGNTLIDDSFKSNYESPSKYPHPGNEKFTEKPKNWSEKQWGEYLKTGILPR